MVHTADSDHLASVETFINALRGSGKAFIHTSGSSVVGDDAWGAYEREAIFTDETPFEPMDIRRDRVAINQRVRNADVELGIRAIAFCPTMIYGDALGLPTASDQWRRSATKAAAVFPATDGRPGATEPRLGRRALGRLAGLPWHPDRTHASRCSVA